MSTGSQAAVTSPLMSTTAVVSPTRRTSIVICGAPIWFPPLRVFSFFLLGLGGRVGDLADGAVEIGKQLDEIRQPGDVEDLAVVRGHPAGDDLPAFAPPAAHPPH